jgi:regulatory protein RepA
MLEKPKGQITSVADNRRAATENRIERPCILPGLRPGRIGVISAIGGGSKSFLTLLACVQKAAGLPILGGLWGPACVGGKGVVFIAREDEIEDLEDRLHSICEYLQLTSGPEFENFVRNLVVCDARFLDPTMDYGVVLPITASGEIINPELVVIDTLSRYLPPGTDENNSVQMTQFFEEIEDRIRKWGAAGLFIHHTNKSGMQAARDDLDAAGTERGSVAITFAARGAWSVRKPSKKKGEEHGITDQRRDEYILLEHTKVNLGRRQPLQWFRKNGKGVPVPINPPVPPATPSPARRPRIGTDLGEICTDRMHG